MAYSYNGTATNNDVRDGNVLTYSDAHTILNDKVIKFGVIPLA